MSTINKQILVVDDEPNVRLMFRTALEGAGYGVSEAQDGPAALACLRSAPADVVLLDLKMPGPSGLEVLRTLRDAGNDVPVVIVTAHGTVPDAVAAMKLGAIDFISKPVTPDVLRRVVGEIVERQAAAAVDAKVEVAAATSAPATVVVSEVVLDLTPAKRALNRREFDSGSLLLEEALETDPFSAEANTLLGVLHECRGQDHAAYHNYKTALTAHPDYLPALDNMRRYCERFGLDFRNPGINPAAR
jgi:DNA-binding response OmpR family regulator